MRNSLLTGMLLVILPMAGLAGCATQDKVSQKYGTPDLVSETVDGQTRTYVPTPGEELKTPWKLEDRTLYYLDQDVKVHETKDTRETTPLDAEEIIMVVNRRAADKAAAQAAETKPAETKPAQ